MSRNKFVEYERTIIIGDNRKYLRTAEKAREENQKLDEQLLARRKHWQILPPENMTIILHTDAGAIPVGLVLSVPHEIGRVILHKRRGRIIERDVTIDALVEGCIEDGFEVLNLGAA